MTGPELKHLRVDLGDAIGRTLSAADMAKLCGLASGDGADTIRRWEVAGPSGPAAELLRILAMASDRHPILEKFNVFDRFNIPENERPARREEFREKMRESVRSGLAQAVRMEREPPCRLRDDLTGRSSTPQRNLKFLADVVIDRPSSPSPKEDGEAKSGPQ